MMPGRIILRTAASISVYHRNMEQTKDSGKPWPERGRKGVIKLLQEGVIIARRRMELALGNLAVLCLG